MAMEGLGLSLFPRINKENIKVWDTKKNACCGFLSKKAGKKSTFSKGKWQKRWFYIKTELTGHENYTLSYFHSPDDSSPSQTFPLEGTSLTTLDGNEFRLEFKDGTVLELDAESYEITTLWVASLMHVIDVATARAKALSDRVHRNAKPETSMMKSGGSAAAPAAPASEPASPAKGQQGDVVDEAVPSSYVPPPTKQQQMGMQVGATSTAFAIRQHSFPTVRLDIDVNSIPPRSSARMKFVEMFIADVCNVLNIDVKLVEVHSIKGMLGMDWLTLVEFDIYIHKDTSFNVDVDEEEEKTEEEIMEQEEMLESIRVERRKELFQTLNELIKDPHSALYNGFITCKLDPTYPLMADEFGGGGRADDANNMLFSTDNNILAIMEKYKDVELPEQYMDMSHFEIQICFEGQMRTLQVPNPLILRRRCCALYPYEIKQALGLLGTAQELWVEPKGLVPRGLPQSLSDPIFFAPSARANGNTIINASKLKANLVYDLICEDYRQEVLDSLSDAEIDQIRVTFNAYDLDGDGTVSKSELETLIRQRSLARRNVVDQKYEEFIAESNRSASEMRKADEIRRLNYQQIAESQNKLIHMFEAADIDGNGKLSLNEFMLAEAWWMRCTLNPEQMHLF